jgi:hypothetical protein
MAIKFFNHCARVSSFIAFVLPRTFKKDSVINKLNEHFYLEYEELLSDNSFEIDGLDKSVPAVFQIWVKRPSRRARVEILGDHEDLEFLPPERVAEADILFQRVHADIGGGYPETQSGPAKYPLGWLIDEAILHGMQINLTMYNHLVLGQAREGGTRSYTEPSVRAKLHNSMTFGWLPFEVIPKRIKWRDWPQRGSLFGCICLFVNHAGSMTAFSYIIRFTNEWLRTQPTGPPNLPTKNKVRIEGPSS